VELEGNSSNETGERQVETLHEADARLARRKAPDPFKGSEEEVEVPDYRATLFSARPVDADAPATEGPEGVLPAGFLPNASFETLEQRRFEVFQREGTLVNFTLRLDGQVLVLDPVPLVRAVAHWEPEGMYDHCIDGGGAHAIGGKCWVFQRLLRVCVQVAQDADGAWRLAPRVEDDNSSYGCSYSRGSWAAATYENVHLPFLISQDWGYEENRAFSFDDFTLSVRSAHDPLFTALALTRGSMSFGWTQAEEDVFGIVLIIIGVVLCFQPMRAICLGYWKQRRGPREISNGRYPGAGDTSPWNNISPKSWHSRQKDPHPETLGMRYAPDEGSQNHEREHDP